MKERGYFLPDFINPADVLWTDVAPQKLIDRFTRQGWSQGRQ